MTRFDFANILLSGRCNARCPFCIGKQLEHQLNQDNLDEYPPRNLERFIEVIRQEGVRQVVLTGTNTDPQLYPHEERLLQHLRWALPPGTQVSLHTNGRLALRKMAVINQYDRVTFSLPSFEPQTYRKMMGVANVPDLYEIMKFIKISFKISCIITDDNATELGRFLERCRGLGVQRVVLRKLYGEQRSWQELLSHSLKFDRLNQGEEIEAVRMIFGQIGVESYRGNPLVELPGMQVTLWDFAQTQSTSLNLFSNGLISRCYLLAKAR
jgi:molybdenum cofactor biosynthesis enzyme MoaA